MARACRVQCRVCGTWAARCGRAPRARAAAGRPWTTLTACWVPGDSRGASSRPAVTESWRPARRSHRPTAIPGDTGNQPPRMVPRTARGRWRTRTGRPSSRPSICNVSIHSYNKSQLYRTLNGGHQKVNRGACSP